MRKVLVAVILCGMATSASALGMGLLSPYVKGGMEIHTNGASSTWPIIGGIGAELGLLFVPLTPFVEAAYTWHSENGVDMKNIPVTLGLKYRFLPLPFVTPYFSAGLSMNFLSAESGAFSSSETKLGMSLRGGLTLSNLIVEAAYNRIFQEGSGSQFYMGGGIKL